jgi:hypothetical protein
MVWERQPGGRDATIRWNGSVESALRSAGFGEAIMAELHATMSELEQFRS